MSPVCRSAERPNVIPRKFFKEKYEFHFSSTEYLWRFFSVLPITTVLMLIPIQTFFEPKDYP